MSKVEDSNRAEDFNHHGFSVEAIKAIAACLHANGFTCSICDSSSDICSEEHFYPQAEAVLSIMSSGFAIPQKPW